MIMTTTHPPRHRQTDRDRGIQTHRQTDRQADTQAEC